MKNIVSVEWLHENLENPSIRIIDCRFHLDKPTEGLALYIEEHIPGALYFDLEKDLSSKVKAVGGRHPLPDIDTLVDKLSAAGIDNDTIVVAYDDQASMIASRLWWLLKYLGHTQVFVLDGGYFKWKSEGYPTTNDFQQFQRKEFSPVINSHFLADMSEVKENVRTEISCLIDSRELKRFEGIEEPIDHKAGHIPGALQYFWRDCLNENYVWKTLDELKNHFNQLSINASIIVYCGSGVSACPNILALDELGYNNTKLYIGSWSDWISYEDNPIELGVKS
ncbi:sulfurtransferase [Bacillus sp. Marseille-P3661]|uniref:sulfurtransferase n=1 Tax=Bacillus sp. Marseille-P3661 TaxID=1936234 RepID=UPI000C822C9F|nr:sulfurtransferase [Bacillus sp. Marseille-P3661]